MARGARRGCFRLRAGRFFRLVMLLLLPGIALGGRHRDADGDEYRQQAAEQFAEQDRQDQRRLEVGGECQVIADGGLGADAQGHAKHLVASIHVFEQVVGGDDVRQHHDKGGGARLGQPQVTAEDRHRALAVALEQVADGEGPGQHDADVASDLDGAEQLFLVGEHRVEAPAAEDLVKTPVKCWTMESARAILMNASITLPNTRNPVTIAVARYFRPAASRKQKTNSGASSRSMPRKSSDR